MASGWRRRGGSLAARLLLGLAAALPGIAGVAEVRAATAGSAGSTAGATISAVSAASAAAEIAARAAPRVLIDDWGRRIELPGAPARIVSLAPHATELLFAAGLGERLVAVDRNSDFPPQAARLPKLAVQPQPDIERLMALRPDLVVVWGSGTREALLERLQAVGIRVFVSEPHSLDEVGRALARFGDFGSVAEAEAARAAARRFAGQLALLRSRFSQRPPVRVFVQVWSMPLIGLSDRDLVGDLLHACGAVNVFGDAGVAAPRLDPEAVLAARPQLVLATEGAQAAQRWRERGLLAPRGPARFAVFDASMLHRPGPRVLQAAQSLCTEIDAVRRGGGTVQP